MRNPDDELSKEAKGMTENHRGLSSPTCSAWERPWQAHTGNQKYRQGWDFPHLGDLEKWLTTSLRRASFTGGGGKISCCSRKIAGLRAVLGYNMTKRIFKKEEREGKKEGGREEGKRKAGGGGWIDVAQTPT